MEWTWQAFASDPVTWIKTGLRLGHLAGLALGVGAATLLDFMIVRFAVTRSITDECIQFIDYAAKAITVGLGLLWITGVGFLAYYGAVEPENLNNPKIWAKIAIVAILTVNGFVVHHYALPRIRAQSGKRLLDGLSSIQCSLLILTGAVSIVSWYVPLLIGATPQLNHVVPAATILLGYALLIVLANAGLQIAMFVWLRRSATPILPARRGMVALQASVIALLVVGGSIFLTSGRDRSEASPAAASRITDGFAAIDANAEIAQSEIMRSRIRLVHGSHN